MLTICLFTHRARLHGGGRGRGCNVSAFRSETAKTEDLSHRGDYSDSASLALARFLSFSASFAGEFVLQMEDSESCCSWKAEADSAQLDTELAEKAEDILLRKFLLHEAADSAYGLAFHVNLLRVLSSDSSLDSLSNLDDYHNHTNSAEPDRNIHEISFAGYNKPKLLNQLTLLLFELDLNIQEAHAFSPKDEYTLAFFIVDGWPYKESDKLRHAIQTRILKSSNKMPPKFHPLLHMIQDDHRRDEPRLDHVQIPRDGIDEWEVDIRLLQFGCRLESTSYGDIYRGTFCNQDVTIKVLNFENVTIQEQREFIQEVYIMRKIRHKNIVQFIGMCTRAPNMFIITEFMSRGNIYDFLHKRKGEFGLPFVLRVAIDVSKGMNYLHQFNIIHRDLKSENLFMNENKVVKVADFGVARVGSQGGIMTFETGTYRWMAPEGIGYLVMWNDPRSLLVQITRNRKTES